ncbi:hypothetical protein BCR33DRAFT_713840 [Rhizoclosmatium globosum]|uniref:Small ribosomal subunit protein mS23 n=1 Tax=Rhizoclosmatium globosum TaxID=329046 RepID=A0A1Y2CRR2_9FUNG|nr:hypothetical protein BCR33DRAFT_713839 [Rhizoclosmatium globosum]ORY49534.1 hypothetical protein BCR33DRAFT_713840 [Rhizoclosmatium globosum]|eukprot:ORY49533.1 hypothetical protein BCR33DRAFT_713839 [Rhizoclosmatium globosum]
MKLRNNPHAILQTQQAQRLVAEATSRGGNVRNAAWVAAVARHPPAPAALPYVVPSAVGHFGHAAAAERTAAAQLASVEQPSRRRMLKPQYTKTAPQIVYPEDSLRQAFYATHPFERLRPRALVEHAEDLKAGTSSDDSVTGERYAFRRILVPLRS